VCKHIHKQQIHAHTRVYIYIHIYRYIHTHNITNINANPATHRTYLNNIVPSPFVVVSSPIHYNMYIWYRRHVFYFAYLLELRIGTRVLNSYICSCPAYGVLNCSRGDGVVLLYRYMQPNASPVDKYCCTYMVICGILAPPYRK